MSQPKVSVIVPVHNAGIYLEKCLSSLVNQTLKDIEIILVLDYPTDGSDKIAERYNAQDNRVKLIYNEENLHTGLSRNRGMEIAQGKYIGFMDHDDYCDFSMYELLYNKAEEENLEVSRCNFVCVYKSESADKDEPYIYPDITEKEQIYEYVSGDKISCVIWNHIYRSDFLKENNIRFQDSRKVCSEDSIFFLEVYKQLKSFGTIPEYLYYHVFHTSNTGKKYGYRSVKKRISFFNELNTFLQENGIDKEKRLSYLSVNMAKSLYTGSRQALLNLPVKQAISDIKQIRQDALSMDLINFLYRKENSSLLSGFKPTIRLFLSLIRKR